MRVSARDARALPVRVRDRDRDGVRVRDGVGVRVKVMHARCLLVSASVYHHTSGSFLRSSLGCRLG